MFRYRSDQKELLDAENIPRQDLHRNLFELNIINSLLGGHAVTIKGIKRLKPDRAIRYSILDIGCGGGDTLRALAVWGRKHGYIFELTGVDLKEECIHYARTFCADFPEIHFIQDDYRNLEKDDRQYDIILTSLFCHHLTDEELMHLFSWGASRARVGFILNDLHRHPLAYFGIAFLTRLFSKSYLVKNDAKLSVLRGFVRKELEQPAIQTGNLFSLSWMWAFRWLLVMKRTTPVG